MMNEREVLAVKNRLTSMQQEFDDWFSEADKKGNAMGPADIDHVALDQIADKVGSLEIVYEGLEQIAPDLERQTYYVLEKLANGVSTLVAETRDMYDAFIDFANSGPGENIGSLNVDALKSFREERRLEFSEHALNLQENAVNIFIATGALENAEVMVKVQLDIHNKHTAFNTRLTSNDLEKLHRELKELVRNLKSFKLRAEELAEEFALVREKKTRRIRRASGLYAGYPEKGRPGVKFDVVFFTSLLKYLELMEELHKSEPILSEVMIGIDGIIGNEKPPLEDLKASVVQDMHDSIGRAYLRIDSAASTAANDYGLPYTEYDAPSFAVGGPTDIDVDYIIQANQGIAENLRSLMQLV